jgi:heterotetrameric sarcosine oxidase delta subunit
MLLKCPWCGPRDYTEFSYAGDATVERPAADAPDTDRVDYVYMRDNPRGPHLEYWHHVQGCRLWVRVRRDTLTHEVMEVIAAQSPERE